MTAVEGRPGKHIRTHLQRRYDPKSQLGVWTLSEDRALIQWVFHSFTAGPCAECSCRPRVVEDLGSKWVDISQRVGRTSSDCRDRYRNHLANRDVRKTGEHPRYN